MVEKMAAFAHSHGMGLPEPVSNSNVTATEQFTEFLNA